MIKFNDNFKGFYSFGIFTEKNNSYNINNKYILPIVDKFFSAREINNYAMIETIEIFNDLDFSKYKFDYFYDFILNDIKKLEDGGVDFSIKYIISFDRILCNDFCKTTNIFYKEFFIESFPCLYFIYVDFHDIIKFSRENN